MNLFITGGTGFLGKYLLAELSSRFDKIYVLSRKTTVPILKDFSNIEIVQGDITHPDIFSDPRQKENIANEITHVIHAAAFYDLKATHEVCYLQNVLGTQNILHFLKHCRQLKFFYYISTIAVADDESFLLEENVLPKRVIFKDHYSKTKYLAEKLVRESELMIPGVIRILRPGIIIGDSKNGDMEKVDGPYYFMKAFENYRNLLKNIKILPLSFNPRTKIPIIPVDHCAHFIALIIDRDHCDRQLGIRTFHLISDEIPTVKEFLDDLLLTFDLNIKFIPVRRNIAHDTVLKMIGIPLEAIPFMFSKISYDKSCIITIVPEIKESKYSFYKNAILKK